MKKFAALISSAMLIASTYSPVIADEDVVAEALKDYQATGATEKCVRVNDIRRTNVIDDQNILFELKNGDAYLNTLPGRCPRLASENRFSYRVTVGQLCNVDTITVLTPFDAGVTCGLGQFKVYKKTDKDS